MLTESAIKAYCDSNGTFNLPKGSFPKRTPLLTKFSKRAPLSFNESLPKKESLNMTYEKEVKSLSDTKNRNRSNPPSHKFYLITIQKKINCEKENRQLLIDKIIDQRKKSAVKISTFINEKILRMRAKKGSLINKIIAKRNQAVNQIKSVLKGYIIRKDLRRIMLCDLVFFYDINDNMIHKISMGDDHSSINNNYNINGRSALVDIKLCLYNHDKKGKEISFNYSKTLKCYYLPLLKRGVIKKKYRVNYILNGQTIIDPRYEVDNDEKGNFYNIVSKSMLFDFKKKGSMPSLPLPEPPTRKYWESIFEMKSKNLRHSNSLDSLSVSNNTELSNEPYFTMTAPISNYDTMKIDNIKSILKNPFVKSESFSLRRQSNTPHHVKFNTTIQYSY